MTRAEVIQKYALVFRHDLRLPGDPSRWLCAAVALALAAALSFLLDYDTSTVTSVSMLR